MEYGGSRNAEPPYSIFMSPKERARVTAGIILFLVIAVFGVAVLFGQAKAENFYKFFVFLIFAPVLAAIGWNHALWFYFGLPLWAQIVCLVLLPFLALAELSVALPKVAWLNTILGHLFDVLAYILAFPFRILFRAARLLAKERQRRSLDPFRPVVGNRPPLEESRRMTSQRSNLFD